MEYRIVGTVMPVLEILLGANESIVAEPGELGWITGSIQLQTSTRMAGAKGLFGVLKRASGGGSLFMTEYRAKGVPGLVAFATKVPGQILPVEVAPGREYLIHRHGYLCGTPENVLTSAFQRSLGAGIFGGEGFVLQKLAGSGRAWIELDGEVVVHDLSPGETLRVHPGHVGMFEGSVRFDIVRLPGITNWLFGGDDLFLAALSGPGKVWLQSLTLPGLAHCVKPYIHTGGEDVGAGAAGGIAAAAFKGLFR